MMLMVLYAWMYGTSNMYVQTQDLIPRQQISIDPRDPPPWDHPQMYAFFLWNKYILSSILNRTRAGGCRGISIILQQISVYLFGHPYSRIPHNKRYRVSTTDMYGLVTQGVIFHSTTQHLDPKNRYPIMVYLGYQMGCIPVQNITLSGMQCISNAWMYGLSTTFLQTQYLVSDVTQGIIPSHGDVQVVQISVHF